MQSSYSFAAKAENDEINDEDQDKNRIEELLLKLFDPRTNGNKLMKCTVCSTHSTHAHTCTCTAEQESKYCYTIAELFT